MVDETTKNVANGTTAAQETASQLEEIVGGSSKVAEFLADIALASKEQAQGVEQINSGLEQIDQVTQSNTANAEESASAAEELAAQAQQFSGMISQFRLKGRSVSMLGARKQHTPEISAKVEPPKGNGDSENGSNGHGTGSEPVVEPEKVIQLDDSNFDRF